MVDAVLDAGGVLSKQVVVGRRRRQLHPLLDAQGQRTDTGPDKAEEGDVLLVRSDDVADVGVPRTRVLGAEPVVELQAANR
jgi:hypothetical protein